MLSVKRRSNSSSVMEGVCEAVSNTLSSSCFSMLKKIETEKGPEECKTHPIKGCYINSAYLAQ